MKGKTHLMLIADIAYKEAQRLGQGRFLLPPCSADYARKRAVEFRRVLAMYKEYQLSHGEQCWPWASERIVVKRYHMKKEGSIGMRMELEVRTYLELLLPLDHIFADVWTGVCPKDKEWGSNSNTVLSKDGEWEDTMDRLGWTRKQD